MSISRVPKWILILIAALLVAAACVYLVCGVAVYSSCDGLFRWQESAYVLRGMDPFLVASGVLPVESDIGALNPDGGNMPWTYLLSNVVYPGFLPYRSALVYAKALFVLLLIVTVWRVLCYIKRTYACSTLYQLLLIGVLFCSYMWFATLRLGNHAAYITLCVFLLLTFDHDEHWALAGVLYAFLLMKPQDSGLFLLFFLLKKHYKAVLLAGGIVLSSMLAASAMVDCAPWTMLLMHMSSA